MGIGFPGRRRPPGGPVPGFARRVSSIAAVVVAVAVGAVGVAPARADVPPVNPAARAEGLADVRAVVGDAIVALAYATRENFTGVQLYPAGARCLVHESMAPGLAAAAQVVRAGGEHLVFLDCYRPHDVQVRMFQVVPDPTWVARPGPYARSHEAGRSVDVTLAGARHCPPGVGGVCLADMGTGFDDFTALAHADAVDGLSGTARANRARLRGAMNTGGLAVYAAEWWHFDGPGAGEDRPILTAGLT